MVARLPGLAGRVAASRVLSLLARWLSTLLTFLAVSFAWVFFRSPDFDSAMRLATAMLGFSGWHEVVLLTRGAGLRLRLVRAVEPEPVHLLPVLIDCDERHTLEPARPW